MRLLTMHQMAKLLERVQAAADETYGGLKVKHVEVGRVQYASFMSEFPMAPQRHSQLTVRGYKVVRTDAFDGVAVVLG